MADETAAWKSELASKLGRPPNWAIQCFDSVESTMDLAKTQFGGAAIDRPMIFLANKQIKGRGRQCSTWSEAKAGFYCTFAFVSPVEIRELAGLSLICGCVLHEVIKGLGAECVLKWPNDVLTKEGRKVCGVLVEI